MQQGSPQDERADALHRVVLSRRPATVDEIPRMFFSWPREQIETAIADLVAAGLLEEGPTGELIVHKRAAA
jgi:hypothetical protein